MSDKTWWCCANKMQHTSVEGIDKNGRFTYEYYWCLNCGLEGNGPRHYVDGTAKRGNKDPRNKAKTHVSEVS